MNKMEAMRRHMVKCAKAGKEQAFHRALNRSSLNPEQITDLVGEFYVLTMQARDQGNAEAR